MTVNISNLTIATPVATSATNPVALELNGAQALAQFPSVIQTLPDGSLQFNAPTKGASSKSTHRTRCEWKESIYWSLASATDHINYQEMTVTKVNSAQKVVVSQMHVKGDDSPAVKVFWNKGNLTMGFRQSYNQPDPVNSTLLRGVPLGTRFRVRIHATSLGTVNVYVESNGLSGTSGDLQLDASWSPQLFDFHGGLYNQIDFSDSTPAEDGSICIISDLQISHT
ncbi:polysaccharide lyase family 7 protein [Pseudomonas vanderleydeniana]|uniref:Polysaccharide lyase family 7 protein n=1 Tax=Pseudomonas vanderleydeniana TaxID=2745495 RepID=A0A9E6PGC4_9PSED|nr:polysaccharide lyase family 7 protein [Pseudomonas vanderleydeniana]QXI25865.1 polysaccharide lyase family 7 protein [Pseudomonas vanderleydeniana]